MLACLLWGDPDNVHRSMTEPKNGRRQFWFTEMQWSEVTKVSSPRQKISSPWVPHEKYFCWIIDENYVNRWWDATPLYELFGCFQVMLQVATYIVAIEVVVLEGVTACTTVFGLGVSNGN